MSTENQQNASNNKDGEQEKLINIANALLEPSNVAKLISKNQVDLLNLRDAIFEEKFSNRFHSLEKIDSKIDISLLKKDDDDTLNNIQNEKEHTASSGLDCTDDDLWIFGYGSLIWKVDFPYVDRKAGYITGYERLFYQNSIDHRGTPQKPGRVVTLIPSKSENSRVWGMAYKISKKEENNVMTHLDYREKNGYEKHKIRFHPYIIHNGDCSNCKITNTSSNLENTNSMATETINVITYIATSENESFAGNIKELNCIVEQIYTAQGLSGHNREYVYKLANAMRSLFPNENDEHLFKIENKLKEKENLELKNVNKTKEYIKELIEDHIKGKLTINQLLVLLNEHQIDNREVDLQ